MSNRKCLLASRRIRYLLGFQPLELFSRQWKSQLPALAFAPSSPHECKVGSLRKPRFLLGSRAGILPVCGGSAFAGADR